MNLRLGVAGLVLVSVGLSGCLFDDSEPPPVPAGSAAEFRLAPVGSESELAARLSAGRELSAGGDLKSQQLVGAPELFAGIEVMADGSGMAPAAGGAGVEALPAMSGDTSVPADDGLNNVQVAGVEEADLVKSDGEYLYVAEQPDQWIYPLPVEIALVMNANLTEILPGDGGTSGGGVAVDPVPRGLLFADKISPRDGLDFSAPQIARYHLNAATPNATPLAPLVLTGTTGYISHLSLLLSTGDAPRLVAMGQSGNYWGWDRWFSAMPYVHTQETRLWIFDVADPENVPAATSVVIKGELVNSRRVDNHLYLVTRYSPTLVADPVSSDPLVPMLTVTGSDDRPLLPPADCLVPEGASTAYPSLTFVVAIDLEDPTATKSACYSGEVYTMYMSRDAIYLAAQRYNPHFEWNVGTRPVPVAVREDGTIIDETGATDGGTPDDTTDDAAIAPVDTIIHRFALNDGDPQYSGSGIVAGGFTGWMGTGSQPQWRFHERNGLLYVVTSWWDMDDLHHHLHVLAPDDNGNLIVAATLPNAEHPEAIGHPREDIFAMRYVGDRAYVVTFRQTDPLYVISLADPLHPVVAGELTLPGFSSYLHPVGTDWLLGIGRGGSGGVEANLFDVRNPAAPAVLHNVVICTTSCDTPLMTDYHAIAAWTRDGVTRVAVPLQDWHMASEFDWRPIERAALLEVTVADGQLTDAGRQDAAAGFTALGRVLLIADAIFQPQMGNVTAGLWPVPPVL